MPARCDIRCGPECAWIFNPLHILPLLRGGTQISWSIHPHFTDPAPYTFQLQVGTTGNPLADDWLDLGDPLTDTYVTEDSEQRMFGMTMWTHYRLVLTTSVASYASPPQNVLGTFDKRDWLQIRNIVRQTSLRLRKKAGVEGYLLKRRLYGEPCDCVDTSTGETRRPNCPVCYETGVIGGYFAPYPCFFVEFLDQRKFRSHVTDRGTENDGPIVPCLMLNTPQIHSYDVWVDKGSDQRWYIHEVQARVELRGVPVVLAPVFLRLAPFTNIVHSLPITGQQD